MKKQLDLTPWFNIVRDGQPTRKGFYEVRYSPNSEQIGKKYWSGKQWSHGPRGHAIGFGNIEHDKVRESWRGLASDPKASA